MKKQVSIGAWMLGVNAILATSLNICAEEEQPVLVEFVREELVQDPIEEETEAEETDEWRNIWWLDPDADFSKTDEETARELKQIQEYIREHLALDSPENEEEIQEEVPEPPEFKVYLSDEGIFYKSQYGDYIENEWVCSELGKYYFGKRGKALSGWQEIKGDTYYFSEKSCIMETGWIAKDGAIWFLDEETGKMQTGFQTIDGKTYYFSEEDGTLQRGVVKIKDNSYFFDITTGEQRTGKCKLGRDEYYFSDDGTMVSGEWVDDCYYGKDGVLDRSQVSLSKLEPDLKKFLKEKDGEWSIYLKKMDTQEELVLNNQPITAASLIKLYAMGAVYQEIKEGKIKEDKVASELNSMITVSSNDAFNSLTSMLGIEKLNEWCTDNGFEETVVHHGLYPSGNGNISDGASENNQTSVADCGRLLEAIYKGKLVSWSSSRKMLGYLKKQERISKIPAGVPEDVITANKTGETDDETHDAAIVFSPNGDYILCVMGAVPGKAWQSNSVITDISKMVYEYINP